MWSLCFICKQVISEFRLLSCQHYFCRECIENSLSSAKSCPECLFSYADKQYVIYETKSLFMARAFSSLKIKCVYEKCAIICTYDELIAHEKLCGEKKIQCQRCYQNVTRKTLLSHQKTSVP